MKETSKFNNKTPRNQSTLNVVFPDPDLSTSEIKIELPPQGDIKRDCIGRKKYALELQTIKYYIDFIKKTYK